MTFVDVGSPGRMPLRTPTAEAIRRQIAEIAAQQVHRPLDALLELLGPVEIIGSGNGAGGWRLLHYVGSAEEHEAIQRAVAEVQRRHRLVRPD
jgi:hypothetical protein